MSTSLQAQRQSAGTSMELQTGIIVDTQSERIYYMTREGGIEAVEIATGTSLWVTQEAEKPVMASPGRLVAHSTSDTPGVLPITFISPNDGRTIMSREARLPDPVKVSVEDRLTYQFKLQSGDLQNPGRLNWQYREQIAQGMLAENPPAPIEYSGEIRIDAQSGDIDVQASSATPPATVVADIELPSTDRSQFRRFRSVGDRYVLVSSPLPADNGTIRYRWQIEDATGSLLGETTANTSYSPFTVSGNVLLFTHPPRTVRANRFQSNPGGTLHGVDLQTGEEIWQRDLRSLKYSGPVPH